MEVADKTEVVQLQLIPQEVESKVVPYNLLFITRSYNQGEISFEEWIRLSKEWAERIIAEYGEA